MLKTSGFTRTTNATQTAFSLSAGRAAVGDLVGPHAPVTLGREGDRYRGCEVAVFGKGDADAQIGYRVWAVERRLGPGRAVEAWELQLVGSGTATLGTAAGAEGAADQTDEELAADTITWTAAAFGEAMEAAYGSDGAAAYSPADNTVARLFLPDLGGADVVVELDLPDSGVEYAFAMVNPKR